jgi:hypothetical protein
MREDLWKGRKIDACLCLVFRIDVKRHQHAPAAERVSIKREAGAMKHVDLSTVRQEMAAACRLRQALFRNYVTEPGFARAYELAAARKGAIP